MYRHLAIPVSLIILLMVGLSRAQNSDGELIDLYHEHVAEVVNEIPIDFGDWTGHSVFLPQSATNLLRPNALVARQYVNEERAIVATLMVAHCKDIRDMAGHYPPRCYPANGWLESQTIQSSNITVQDQMLRVYGFERTTGQDHRMITVYSIFALPTNELTTSMKDVRKLSADYEYREYGAAQIQIVIEGDTRLEQHQWVIEELLRIAQPTIHAVLHPQHLQGDETDHLSEGDEQ